MQVYRGLADIQAIRLLVLSKLKSMLLHNYPKVRVSAAEMLFICCEDESVRKALKPYDWTKGRVELKPVVDKLGEPRGQ
jgi:hypothetical protein